MKTTWRITDFDKLTVQELHDLLRLREDIFVVEQKCAYHEIDGQDPTGIHILGTNAMGRLIAYGRILPANTDGLPHVGRIVVSSTERGRGLATELMELALDTLRKRFGSANSALAAQSHLEHFYARFGYVRTGDDYPWDGIPHVDMVRKT